jgi:hypothetical protein
LAQSELDQGTNQLFTDKAVGIKSLREAASDFSQVKDLTHDPLLRAWALYGIGLSRESLNELDAAREAYKQLVDSYPDSTFAASAKDRLKDLESPDTKAFYDWFATQTPVPQSRSEPGVPGQKPLFDLSSPEGGIDLSSPAAGGVKLPSNLDATTTPSADLPKLPQPAADDKKADLPLGDTPPANSSKSVAPKTEAPTSDLPKSDSPDGNKK